MRFKGLAALGLAAVMACSLAVPAAAEYVEDKELTIGTALASDSGDEFKYSSFGELIKYNGTAENVVIPDNIRTITAGAFAGNKTVKTITIPAKVSEIAAGAFSDCTALTAIKVNSANGTYEVEKGVLYLWYGSKKMLHTYPAAKTGESFTVPSGVCRVLSNAFKGTSKLKTVKLSKTVEQLNDYAFSGCKSLKTVTITTNVKEVGANVFLNCPKLQSITGGSDKPWNRESCVTVNGVLYSPYADLLCYPEGKTDKTFTIPEKFGGCYIQEGSISNNKYLQKVMLRGDMVLSGSRFFSGCSSLASVEVSAVKGYNTLSSKNGVLFREGELVYYPAAKKGESYTVPKDTTVCSYAFADAKNLKTVTLSEGVRVPSNGSVSIVGGGSSSVSAIKVNSKHKELSAKDGVLYNKDKTELICVPPQCEKKSLKLPSSVGKIYGGAFANCNTIESVEIPRGVRNVFFNNCTALKTVTLPVSVTCIISGNGVGNDSTARFSSCGSLSKIIYKGNRSVLEYSTSSVPEGVTLVCADD